METNLKFKTMVSASLLLASLAIAGCGGSSGGGTTVTSPNGIYTGTITGGNPSVNGNEKAIIYNNQLRVVSESNDNVSQIFVGDLILNGLNYTGTANYLNNSSSRGPLALNGSYVNGASATVNFTDTAIVPGLSDGTIELTTNTALYNTPSTAANVTGVWSGIYIVPTMTITVNSDGTYSGSDNEGSGSGSGCNFTGTIVSADSSVNVYNVTLVSDGGCVTLPAASDYTGLAWKEDANTMIFSVSNATAGRSIILLK